MAEYVYLIHPMRQGFFEQATSEEEAVVEAHYEYLKQATEEGVLLLAGPCLDETFGLVIFKAESDEAAREFMLNDPSVRSNLMVAELHPMRVSLMRKS
jgi:uncharacterized protein YciI